jgi:ParB family chromosome partitioning protein
MYLLARSKVHGSKMLHERGTSMQSFCGIFCRRKNRKRGKSYSIQKKLDNYFTPDMSTEAIEELIVRLLDEWKAKGEQA